MRFSSSRERCRTSKDMGICGYSPANYSATCAPAGTRCCAAPTWSAPTQAQPRNTCRCADARYTATPSTKRNSPDARPVPTMIPDELRELEPDFWRAPSAHNTQPWVLRYGDTAAEIG